MRLKINEESTIETIREFFNDCDHKLIIGRMKEDKWCMFCRRRAKLIIGHYKYDENKQYVFGICKKHFREIFINYTLEKNCISCKKNFNCVVQKTIFSKKEIRNFKKKFLNAGDFELNA